MRQRAGVTLIEMLVAMAISLIMMAAVANLFAVVGGSVSASRALINVSEQLRNARNLLQSDLAGVTAPTIPPLRPENGDGYLEYIERSWTDSTAYNLHGITNTAVNANYTYGLLNQTGQDTLTGDPDDVLMFTTRSKNGQPFVGKFLNGAGYTMVDSQTAEVVWFAVPNGRKIPLTDVNGQPYTATGGGLAMVQLYTLYRRALLVAPEYAPNIGATTGSTFFANYDLSAHWDAVNNVMVPNSMSDLTKRENRFGHAPLVSSYAQGNFPFSVYLPPYIDPTTPNALPFPPAISPGGPTYFPQGLVPLGAGGMGTNRTGEDVVLNNVLAFDVKVYDPTVPLYAATTSAANTIALQPSDLGYWGATGNHILGYGGFVDLGYSYDYVASIDHSGAVSSTFSAGNTAHYPVSQYASGQGSPHYSSLVTLPTYDTWSLHYEGPGPWNTFTNYYATPGSALQYNGMNGFDDDGVHGVDDPGEFLFPPPYWTPLRGIQVKIRVYEPDSKQIREVTIVQDFLP